MQLELFQQVTQAVQILWQGHLLVLNLTQMDAIQAQRAVDFVAGANYSIDGQQQHLAPGLFLFAPKDVCLAKAVAETAAL
ncbi:MAG: Cell division protein SepF [Chroococcidiopsis sp. SAG 2025]|uniref:cell division protein SepF n=1 Tax=Chroococcidiopsis sp. SAG 2025 TaxID=171389 RepID=UPI002936F98C|nr:cell division protein SepF [Chroococcidiopsis sp. SAG 2025]MDV2996834.1 Cell division protein SepF [Chroococcidiopsis sp. SAG 2025]